MKIFWLGEADCHDAALVGEKAAVLSRLAAEHPVPPGFCVPVSELALVKGDQAGATTLQTEVTTASQTLVARWGSDMTTLIVRPSYMTGPAGAQREPLLANSGAEVLTAVKRCLRVAQAEHLLVGRPMASVLVQPLVVADVTVWSYSLNPATGNQQEVVVEAAWGLPEGIIGCEAGRDRFVLSKSNLALVEQTIADKRQMVLALPGGPREVKVPHYLRQQAVLNLSQVVEAAARTLALEEALGRPMELACAYQDKRLYLLNCRMGRPVARTAGRSARLRKQALTLLAL